MYQDNNKVLEEFAANSYYADETYFQRIRQINSEQEQICFLREHFNFLMEKLETIQLWDENIPEYHPEYSLQNKPQIAFFPAKSQRPKGLILVCPGGGYNVKSANEGFPTVKKMLDAGFAAAILDYRLKPYTQYVSLLDLQRAIRILRYRAEELGILPDKITVAGFSAGANLASMAAVHFDYGMENSADEIDRKSCRPDAAILGYGLFSQISFPPKLLHFINYTPCPENEYDSMKVFETDTFPVLPVEDPDLKHKLYFSPEKNIRIDCPPFFIWQTCQQDDPRYALNFAKELTDYGIPFELHLFPDGLHGLGTGEGFGLSARSEHVMNWTKLASEWMNSLGF